MVKVDNDIERPNGLPELNQSNNLNSSNDMHQIKNTEKIGEDMMVIDADNFTKYKLKPEIKSLNANIVPSVNIKSELLFLNQKKTHIFHPKSVFSLPVNKSKPRPRSKSENERKKKLTSEIGKIRHQVNLARKIKLMLNKFSMVCMKTLYSRIGDQEDYNHIHKYKNKRFNRILTKNIFRLLSEGKNIFNYDHIVKMTKSDLMSIYDIQWIERKLNWPLKTDLNKLPLSSPIIDLDEVKSHPLRVIKRYQGSYYVYKEWKDCFRITQKQYLRLKVRYNHLWGLFGYYVFLLLLRYGTLSSNNFHCSVPPNLIKKYQLGEFFGSPLNTISDIYYSPFEDIECLFGSQGNFFTSDIRPGNYICNPPFDPLLINKTFDRVIEILDSVPGVCILVNVPVYDYTEKDFLDVYKDRIEQHKKSKYLVESAILNKDKYKHYNYYSDIFIPVSDTELILYSNCSFHPELKEIKKAWKKSIREVDNDCRNK